MKCVITGWRVGGFETYFTHEPDEAQIFSRKADAEQALIKMGFSSRPAERKRECQRYGINVVQLPWTSGPIPLDLAFVKK